jgi:DMSO/TMAO reductase YedYZ molybdopterin-dependent catalytic subunit
VKFVSPSQKSWSLLLLLLLCVPASALAQVQPAIALRVTGDVRTQLALSLADIAKFQHQTIHVTDEKGTAVEYEGVPVAEILAKAGAPLGKELKGGNMAEGLVACAPDGYQVLFSLAEFDPTFNDRVIILADSRDGKPLDAHEGPLRFIVPGDKRHARWIRGVRTLEVFRAAGETRLASAYRH